VAYESKRYDEDQLSERVCQFDSDRGYQLFFIQEIKQMKAQELISTLKSILKEHAVGIKYFAWGDYKDEVYDAIKAKLGDYDSVFEDRLASGDHDHYQVVWKFEDHNVFVSVIGWYDSNNGTDFDSADLIEVEPVEVKTIEYQKVK